MILSLASLECNTDVKRKVRRINMNTTNEKVLFEVDEQGVATVTLNNPDKHNAFDDEIIKQLTTYLMILVNVKILVSWC